MTKKRIVFLSLSVALMVTLLAGALFGQSAQKANVYRYLSIFHEVFDLVRTNYVDTVSNETLMDGAFSGVTDAVDEFSYYVPPAQMNAYKGFTDVEDNNVGVIVTKRFGYAYVIAPVAGSPAEKAGLERGDFIEAVDGASTSKMAVWQVRAALQKSRPMKVQILRGGETKRTTITIEPKSFHPVAPLAETISGVAYVKIPYFEEGSAAQFRAALEDARKRNIRKLIVDLRGNAGGSVEEAINAADELLTSGLITTLEGRKVEARRWQANRDTAYDGELQVLTDISSASGAEVFAAAIRGNNRGKVVGITTYGKAIVQKFIALPSGGGVQMTVARYTTPDLKTITDTGIKPDVVVDLSAQSIQDPDGKRKDQEEDLILDKALELYGVKRAAEKKAAEHRRPAWLPVGRSADIQAA
ncbi:MAG TPA: S41 family peptidase [Thermoanaerobaculia bacterium]|nr:S41 family peptidase [Thermoanaerobaculia bacterium]